MLADKIAQLSTLFEHAKYIVVLTGAGISTESGIPDFRSPNTGLWTKFPEYIVEINYFKKHPLDFYNFISIGFNEMFNAKPNFSHFFLAKYEKKGEIRAIITQNIDGLHQKAGSTTVLELHGNMNSSKCLNCGKSFKTFEIINQFKTNKEIPYCGCGGLIKPDIIFFGEMLPEDVLNMSANFAGKSDLFLVLGSSLMVSPASYIPIIAVNNGSKLAIINYQKTPFDSLANVVINDKISKVLELLNKHIEVNLG